MAAGRALALPADLSVDTTLNLSGAMEDDLRDSLLVLGSEQILTDHGDLDAMATPPGEPSV